MKKILLSLILVTSIIAAKAQNAAIEKITTSYFGVKNALVASNSTLAKARSAELVAVLSAPVKGLQPAQQKLMATYLDKLKFDSRHISQTTVLDHQREHFQSLSKNMYSLLSGLKINSIPVYQQYCPMKKAAWLSESEEIRNPYYGDDMLECGKITATLKATK
ncbi:DUF3347 domain-containing protein [Mucilaginibacter phyllosphaerae]|uniref:DUF3347 domain-containing protein n=1 Tax=Mucilaginibacter phyllosphaerae TaxID=1812349 RepID=A0A4Y8A5Y5_9SPHI|nr:DUF3347 domain-containing protein [Mucilaginibacter phyllosphaerae]MBB3971075.1 hypothetical protein [Mucilaginibacter phyllosphaerae]TEW63813.1 DUF3347 domain-containing protein [Mucilaginibacter phyllosphaerae]GGH22325.1 hypothetical protein GCM10007352_35570 [Mucilaginibacter phyllosphaerae]